jgi:hypothetical protein
MDAHCRFGGNLAHNVGVHVGIPIGGLRGNAGLGCPGGVAGRGTPGVSVEEGSLTLECEHQPIDAVLLFTGLMIINW